jgi:N-methylhydantoinase A
VTDAHVVLGRLSPRLFLGGEMPLYPELARQAVGTLAAELGVDLLAAADGILRLINHNMAAAIRARTIQKGHDPRAFSLVAFGGAGPLHAVDVAEILGIGEVLVPMYPGLTSALGLLTTDLKYDVIRTELMLNVAADPTLLTQHFEALERQVREQLRQDDVPEDRVSVARYADCRYAGQGYELRVRVPAGALTTDALASVWNEFHDLHRVEYGHSFPSAPIEIVNIRVVGIGGMPKLANLSFTSAASLEDAILERATSFFAIAGRLQEVPTIYYDRHRVPVGVEVAGPAVLFQKDTTTVIPPGWKGMADEAGNLVLTRAAGAEGVSR